MLLLAFLLEAAGLAIIVASGQGSPIAWVGVGAVMLGWAVGLAALIWRKR